MIQIVSFFEHAGEKTLEPPSLVVMLFLASRGEPGVCAQSLLTKANPTNPTNPTLKCTATAPMGGWTDFLGDLGAQPIT